MIEKVFEDVKEKFKDHPKRFTHTLGVIKTAVSLSIRYGVDSDKAYLAALFHDYTKYETVAEQTKFLSHEEIIKFEDEPVIYHALSAAETLKNKYQITDTEILNAIRHHVYGNKNMTTLDKIILVADKTEPSRDYPLVNDLRDMSLKSLDQTIIMYLEDRIKKDKEKKNKNTTKLQEIIESIGE
jgi:predicted HD superfamily hydrolase involved in NAD metabolism